MKKTQRTFRSSYEVSYLGRPLVCTRAWKAEKRKCSTLCSMECPRYWEIHAKERKEMERRRKMTSLETCRWMIAEEKRRGLTRKGEAGRFAIWYPRSERTGNILPPPKDAVMWGFFEHRWIMRDEVGPDTKIT